jgi:hypothetical protein
VRTVSRTTQTAPPRIPRSALFGISHIFRGAGTIKFFAAPVHVSGLLLSKSTISLEEFRILSLINMAVSIGIFVFVSLGANLRCGEKGDYLIKKEIIT